MSKPSSDCEYGEWLTPEFDHLKCMEVLCRTFAQLREDFQEEIGQACLKWFLSVVDQVAAKENSDLYADYRKLWQEVKRDKNYKPLFERCSLYEAVGCIEKTEAIDDLAEAYLLAFFPSDSPPYRYCQSYERVPRGVTLMRFDGSLTRYDEPLKQVSRGVSLIRLGRAIERLTDGLANANERKGKIQPRKRKKLKDEALKALEAHNGDKQAAADSLGISLRALNKRQQDDSK